MLDYLYSSKDSKPEYITHKHFKNIRGKEMVSVENLAYSTILIECENHDGSRSSGTGFFVELELNKETDEPMLVLVTNKHVVEEAKSLELVFTVSVSGMPTDKTHSISLDAFRLSWRFHPDVDVDLCALQLSDILSLARRDGIELMISPFTVQQIANKDDLQKMVHGEDVYMIGYPDGIRDTVNNQPIFRRGVLATSPRFDFEGKPHFLIDMAVFHGSSGSPVVSIRYGMCVDTLRLVYRGFEKGKVKLLGVVFATHVHDSPGEIHEIATTNMMAITRIPNNLGAVVKADRIIELGPLFAVPNKVAKDTEALDAAR